MGSWADHAIEQLKLGKEVEIVPHGQSMKGKVESGQKVLLAPSSFYQPGDIVLVKCKGNVYLHLIKAEQGGRFQIGNNKGGINGWVRQPAIFGKAIRIG